MILLKEFNKTIPSRIEANSSSPTPQLSNNTPSILPSKNLQALAIALQWPSDRV
jgi:hypothetical protein